MSLGRVLASLLLVTLAAADITPNEKRAVEQPKYKCLTCEKGTDLMCFNNETCPTGHTYCFYRLVREYNHSKSKFDADYYINYREWGCTKDLDSCESECNAANCTNHSRCCNADLHQLSGNYSDANHLAYRECYYGTGTRVDFPLNCHFLVLTVLLLNWLVRWERGGETPLNTIVGLLLLQRFYGEKGYGCDPCDLFKFRVIIYWIFWQIWILILRTN